MVAGVPALRQDQEVLLLGLPHPQEHRRRDPVADVLPLQDELQSEQWCVRMVKRSGEEESEFDEVE